MNTLKAKPQGKISEALLLKELLAKTPKKLKDIAPLVGSIAKTDSNKAGAIIEKVRNSPNLQKAFAKARDRGLEVSKKMLDRYEKSILANDDVEKVGSRDRLELLNKTINTISGLTRDNKSENQGDQNIFKIEQAIIQLVESAPSASIEETIDLVEGEVVE